jgi:type VI secretion system FHA domain protein
MLRILSPSPAPEPRSHVFAQEGGSIGRAPDTAWVLPDSKLSRWHAIIGFRDGTFTIEDLSRNGVCLNGWNNRLAGGSPHPLRSGDTLFIDPYEIEVRLEAESDPALPAR